ncbi:MAG: hypothetical protein SCM11_12645 [Bacillota bacterium]|nr:hypothetical protein [Bacillota bacterium]
MKSEKKRLVLLLLLILVLISLSACVPGDGKATTDNAAGFFWGIWHGWLAPISLIIGLFNRDIRIYETLNTGWWYDFGFYMAIISGFGGISLVRRKKKDS